MTKATIVCVLTAGLLAGAARVSQAQNSEPKMFAGIEFGAQPTQRNVTSTTSFSLYDETATVTTTQPIHNGPIFGGSVGYRVNPAFGVAAGITVFKARSADAVVAASIPDPLIYNSPKNVATSATGLSHSQLGIHIQALWFHPLSDTFELVLGAGPSIISVSHDVATASVTTGTQNVTTGVTSQSGKAFGFNVGGEGNYRITEATLVGIFVRYVTAKTDLDSVADLKVGGLQAGVGLRLRF